MMINDEFGLRMVEWEKAIKDAKKSGISYVRLTMQGNRLAFEALKNRDVFTLDVDEEQPSHDGLNPKHYGY